MRKRELQRMVDNDPQVLAGRYSPPVPEMRHTFKDLRRWIDAEYQADIDMLSIFQDISKGGFYSDAVKSAAARAIPILKAKIPERYNLHRAALARQEREVKAKKVNLGSKQGKHGKAK